MQIAGSSTKRYYYLTDGGGRHISFTDSLGSNQEDQLVFTQNGGNQAGSIGSSETFDNSRGESPKAPQLSFYRNRYYDQQTGRFTQEDPIGIAGGVNLYAYAGNNPVVYTDPFGLCPPIEDCIRKLAMANLVGTAMIQANGGQPLSLGSRPEGTSGTLLGFSTTATEMTNFGLGTSATGNAGIGFTGELQVDMEGMPDPLLTKGVLDLGTGQFEAKGTLNNLPFSSAELKGNMATGEGVARGCVLVILCTTTPFNMYKGNPAGSESPKREQEE
jgi:RHS repeat-associated protein